MQDKGPAARTGAKIDLSPVTMEALGYDFIASEGNVADWDSTVAAFDKVKKEVGEVDVLVNNAGIMRDVLFHKMSIADFESVIAVHLLGSFYVSRAAAPHFREQNSGVYIHVTSTSGLIGNLGQANYATAKLGIAALSKSIALDMKRFNIRSNCIAPFAWTRMTSSIPTDTPEQQARVEQIKKMTADKVGVFVAYLASDYAQGVTGQIFGVRNNEIYLFSQPRPIRSVHRGEGWTIETLAKHGLPALRSSLVPLDVTLDVISWDPV